VSVGVHGHPFHYIYHHVQSCGVPYAPSERADTLPLFLLYSYMHSVVQTVRAGPKQRVGHHLPHQGHPRPAGHRDWSCWKPPGNYGPICSEKKALKSMLRNRDILVRKRIRGGPCLWLLDPDPDPAVFVIDLQDASKKLIFLQIFSAY
jgi:hypothetical protein